jgi:hypothetical protein
MPGSHRVSYQSALRDLSSVPTASICCFASTVLSHASTRLGDITPSNVSRRNILKVGIGLTAEATALSLLGGCKRLQPHQDAALASFTIGWYDQAFQVNFTSPALIKNIPCDIILPYIAALNHSPQPDEPGPWNRDRSGDRPRGRRLPRLDHSVDVRRHQSERRHRLHPARARAGAIAGQVHVRYAAGVAAARGIRRHRMEGRQAAQGLSLNAIDAASGVCKISTRG